MRLDSEEDSNKESTLQSGRSPEMGIAQKSRARDYPRRNTATATVSGDRPEENVRVVLFLSFLPLSYLTGRQLDLAHGHSGPFTDISPFLLICPSNLGQGFLVDSHHLPRQGHKIEKKPARPAGVLKVGRGKKEDQDCQGRPCQGLSVKCPRSTVNCHGRWRRSRAKPQKKKR